VLTADELTAAVLTARSSVVPDADRPWLAVTLAAAAVETETAREGARYTLYSGSQSVLSVAMPGLTDVYTATPAARAPYAERLGAKADALAQADPMLAPERIGKELQAVLPPEDDPQLMSDRLLRLAVATSQQAALSSRMELYPWPNLSNCGSPGPLTAPAPRCVTLRSAGSAACRCGDK
jgi:hypothetical protein